MTSKQTGKAVRRLTAGVLALQIGFAAMGAPAFASKVTVVSPHGVETLAPNGAIQSTGTWDVGTRAGDYIYVAGMRGIDPSTNKLVSDEEGRIRQAFLNMQLIAESEGATLQDATRLVVYVTDMYRYRPIVNQIQEELWGAGPYPPRTIIEVDRLNQDDIVEVEGTFYAPQAASKSGSAKGNSKSNGTTTGTNVSPNGVITLSPKGAIQSTGTWNLGTRAGDSIFVAGMRGIDPSTNQLVTDEEGRIRQAFLNMKLIAESEGATLQDATRLIVYVTDMYRYRPIVNKIQEELWGAGPYPPRTIVEVDRLNQDDIAEVEGTFYAPQSASKKAASQVVASNTTKPAASTNVSPNGVKTLSPEGAIQSTGTWDLGTRAGDNIYVAGMRGIDPATNQLVSDEEGRIRQAFLNMKQIAESEGATLRDATRLVVYVTDMYRYRPIVNQIQEELWGSGPYPPRTIIEVDRLNQDDIVEVEGTFYAPEHK
ncbi:RidA family protein [Paenibacillus xylanilyticus]|uniref:RidA family protein n=1 Tax=Paenibacillus xylanilyticus TaxID=248903 RepID=UPI0039A31188